AAEKHHQISHRLSFLMARQQKSRLAAARTSMPAARAIPADRAMCRQESSALTEKRRRAVSGEPHPHRREIYRRDRAWSIQQGRLADIMMEHADAPLASLRRGCL